MSKKNYNDGTKLSTRAYSFNGVIYEIDSKYLINKLEEGIINDLIRHYSFIVHDKDIITNEDGTTQEKPKHTHLIITFSQNVSVKQIQERILKYTEHNSFFQPLKDKRQAYRYLTHKDDLDKFQYNDNDIISNDDYFSKEDKLFNPSKEADELNAMIDDYKNHIGYRNMALKYGRDFIKNYKSYSYFFDLVIEEEKTTKCK